MEFSRFALEHHVPNVIVTSLLSACLIASKHSPVQCIRIARSQVRPANVNTLSLHRCAKSMCIVWKCPGEDLIYIDMGILLYLFHVLYLCVCVCHLYQSERERESELRTTRHELSRLLYSKNSHDEAFSQLNAQSRGCGTVESRVDFLIAEYPAYIKLKGGGDSFSTSSIWRSEVSMVL